jgi:hypothetical protein
MRDMASMDAPAECRTGLELAAEELESASLAAFRFQARPVPRAWRVPPFALAASVGLMASLSVMALYSYVRARVASRESQIASAALDVGSERGGGMPEAQRPPAVLHTDAVASSNSVYGGETVDLPSRLVIDSERAVALAREGRLLVRVAPGVDNPGFVIESLEAGDSSWSISNDVSASVLDAVRGYFVADAEVVSPAEVGPNQGRFLVSEMFGPPVNSDAGMKADSGRLAQHGGSEAPAAYIAHLDNSAAGLQRFKSELNARLRAGVLFEALPQALDYEGPGGNSISVPIIIERR